MLLFHKLAAAVTCGLLAAAMLTGTASGAVAGDERPSRVVLRDGTGDVWAWDLYLAEPPYLSPYRGADVTRAVARHRAGAVVIRMSFADLKRVRDQTFGATLRTSRDWFEVILKSTHKNRRGHLRLVGGVRCPGLSHRIDYAADAVTMRVPRRCLGRPDWVRISMFNDIQVADHYFVDNPHNRRADWVGFTVLYRERYCLGAKVTILGSPGDDVVEGTPGDDVIATGSGADVIRAGPGRDRVCAGSGADVVVGGPGADRLTGQDGNDVIKAGRGDDQARGRRGDDRINMGPGDDTNRDLRRETFRSREPGDDIIRGGPGTDVFGGGPGSDRLFGGRNGDFIGDREPDGSGIGGMVFLPGRDRVFAGSGSDGVTGSRAPAVIHGGSGDDALCGGPAADVIDGGPGRDSADGDGTIRGLGKGDTFLRTDVSPHCALF